MEQRIAASIFLVSLAFVEVLGECDQCNTDNPVACHNETAYSLCFGGKPTLNYVSCPADCVCTADVFVCYSRSTATPSCVRNEAIQLDTSNCSVCASKGKVFACLDERTIAFCFGEDVPYNESLSYCPEGTVCDLNSGSKFCSDNTTTVPSCGRSQREQPTTTSPPISTTIASTATAPIPIEVLATTTSPTTITTTIPTTTTSPTPLTTPTTTPTTTPSTTPITTPITTPTTTTSTTPITTPTTTPTTTTSPTPITTPTTKTSTTPLTTLTTTPTTTTSTTPITTTTSAPTTTIPRSVPTTQATTATTIPIPTTTTTPTARPATTIPEPTSTTEPTLTEQEMCEKNGKSVSMPQSNDSTCKGYIVCSKPGSTWVAIPSKCSASQWFDPTLAICSANYQCPTLETTSATTTITSTVNTTVATTATTPIPTATTTTPVGTTTTVSSLTPAELCERNAKQSSLPQPNDPTCTGYIVCTKPSSSWIAMERNCATNKLFDPDAGKCSETYNCPT